MNFRLAISTLIGALVLTGCGRSLPVAGLHKPLATGLRAHGGGWQDPVVLDDFNRRHAYGVYAPDHHPFFKPLVFTFVGLKGGSNTALELLAPAQETQPRKGFVMREDLDTSGSFLPPDADEHSKPAAHVKLSFRWNVNGAVSPDPAIFAMVAFQLAKRLPDGEEMPVGLCYAWTNEKYCPGQVLKTVIGDGEEAVPARVIVLRSGLGFGPKPCGAGLLDEMYNTAAAEQRSLEADLAYINARMPYDFASKDQATGNGPDRTPCGSPGQDGNAVASTVDQPFISDIDGVMKVGAGADMPQAVCAHSLIDDITMQLKFER